MGARSKNFTDKRRSVEYRCVVCDRLRSSAYHSRHPPEEPSPPPGVCRRCKNQNELKEYRPPPPTTKVYEVHHYHHTCTCEREKTSVNGPAELPLWQTYPSCVELPAEEAKDHSHSQRLLFERPAPSVRLWTKPIFHTH